MPMLFPDFLASYRTAGQKLVDAHAIGEVNFSGPTYQIEVHDPASTDSLWVFLQLDEQNEIKDLFCSCEASSEQGGCAHMAASCLYIYGKTKEPLHTRFEHSFWNALFFPMVEKCATLKAEIKKKGQGFEVYTGDGVLLFSCSKAFERFFTKKKEETEETSIKFSNLTEEEVEHYRAGRPSRKLRYELSFFSDIAKWLFLKDNVQVKFLEKKFPEAIEIDLGMQIPLQKEDLVALIPTLNTVQASLELLHEKIDKVAFDQNKGHFLLTHAKKPEGDAQKIGNWYYFPKMGFWPVGETSKTKSITEPQEIESFLNRASSLVTVSLPDIPCNDIPEPVTYKLFFDKEECLHIIADILPPAFVWGTWVFQPKKGFFVIEPLLFKTAQKVLHGEEIVSFILSHRTWLSQFKGFTVHIAKLEEEIVYSLDETGNLEFRSQIQQKASGKERIKIGHWTYVKNDGFYLERFTKEHSPLPLNEPIKRHMVGDFIRHHQDLLLDVPHFFTKNCPIKEVGIQVRLKKRGVIELLPEYSWHDPLDARRALFYDEFVYIPKNGFYRLPQELRPLHFTRTITADDPQVWSTFFLETLPRLKQEYSCKVDPRLEAAEQLALTIVPEGSESKQLSNWELDIFWKTTKGKIGLSDLIALKKQGERFVPTDAGLVDLTQDRFHWLDQSVKKGAKGHFRLDSQDFLRLSSYDTIHVETAQNSAKEAFKQILEKLLNLAPTEPPKQLLLQCTLRPYQQKGVDWLWFLYQHRLSGLLCDDMGVGKTHQAMGLMDAITACCKEEGRKPLFLVICPTSLIYHWEDKVKRFLPQFKVKVHVTTQRTLEDFPGDYDLLLTSYGIWRNESVMFKKHRFDAAFFDELQIAKNHISQIHAALLQVQADMRIGLTGTPIENQLRELKAVFDVVLPGYMPKEADFREFFMRPIERAENPDRKKLLSRYVRPFILRRRKADVLPDLPEKTEEIYVAELLGEQKNLYRQVASLQALPLIQQLKDESVPIPYMHIFALISSLKQICNHPATYLKDVANFERYESGKWEAFVELLEEAMESEQKVVVFSQYLAMLDILEGYLQKHKIGYAQIRGQTKNRGNEVARFHDDANCKVFLGSLQAAGLGIDLTPASIVIHYDRWWNAARENQATDRVHRIGQQRGVQVFKLMTKASIEEKIDLMILKKANLLEDVVSFDDHQIVKRLSRNEIISLLEGLPEE